MLRVLGELKGATMKIGQILSSDPDLVPPEFIDALTNLQRDAPPMTYRRVREIIETGFDRPIDAVFELDTRPAASSDDVVDTIHYGEAAQQIAEIVAGEPVALLETLADRIAWALLADDRLDAVTVVVHKPQAPIPLSFADVSVSIRRERGAR